MSYATSLLTTYPSLYGPSTLLSDELVQRPSFGSYYEPMGSYTGSSRLLSDSFTHNQLGTGLSSYQRSPITNWQRELQPPTSYTSFNDVREYSESLATTSNTNTASTVAHSIHENNFNNPTSIFPNYQQSYSRTLNDVDRNSHLTPIWSPPRSKITLNDEKPTPTHRSVPQLSTTVMHQQASIEEMHDDRTPVPSPPIVTKQESNLHRNPTITDHEKHHHHHQQQQQQQPPSTDVQVWLNENKDETPIEEKAAEQVWTEKIDHLHTVQGQREKEKAKSSRALPSLPKRQDDKSPSKTRKASFQMQTNSYFDSLFDGNYIRKSSQNQPALLTRNQTTNNSLNKTKTSLYPKYIAPRKALYYQPPTVNRAQLITTYKKTAISPRENIHKDADDRFREALNKFRSDRAEQQQKGTIESTAKRLHYGDYIRHTSKDKLMHTAIKPSPWSDFMDMKKGNVYSLKKEEKKELYNQSRSYGERIRHRNFALLFGNETARTQLRSIPLPMANQEPQLAAETSPETEKDDDDDDSKSLERPESGATTKRTNQTYTKPIAEPAMISNRSDRTTNMTDQSSAIQPSDEEDDETSDFESSRKQKKSTRYSKYDSSTRTASATEESDDDETSDQRSTRMRNRDTDDDLFTVREEKTLESFEGARYKKR